MYLKLAQKISPRQVASALDAVTPKDEIDWDFENVYEWALVELPEVPFSLNITRDHGQSEVLDEELDLLTDDEIENLPSSGPTYIFGWNRIKNSHIDYLESNLIQRISDALGCKIFVYAGRIDMEKNDSKSEAIYEPGR